MAMKHVIKNKTNTFDLMENEQEQKHCILTLTTFSTNMKVILTSGTL